MALPFHFSKACKLFLSIVDIPIGAEELGGIVLPALVTSVGIPEADTNSTVSTRNFTTWGVLTPPTYRTRLF